MIYGLIAVIGYLLGSINVAIVYIRRRYRADIRDEGSGNAGATNVARVHGLGAGLLTLGTDMLKAAAAGWIGWRLAGETGLAVACAASFTGHCWPEYFGFRGGKGVSVAACIALLFDWRFFLMLLALFAAVFLLSRKVSLCSVTAAVCYPGLYYLLHPGFGPAFFVCCYIMAVVVYLHRGNIRRLLRGEEPDFRPGKRG